MPKTVFKGIVEKVSEQFNAQGSDLKIKDILFRVPAFVDGFGDTVGKEQFFEVSAFNDKIKLYEGLKAGDKVEVEAFLNSRKYESQSGVFYQIKACLSSIKQKN